VRACQWQERCYAFAGDSTSAGGFIDGETNLSSKMSQSSCRSQSQTYCSRTNAARDNVESIRRYSPRRNVCRLEFGEVQRHVAELKGLQ
jgi:hypothetical protein